MGDMPQNTGSRGSDDAHEGSQQTSKSENTPFQSQFEYISQVQPHAQNVGQYGQHPFDMAAMAGALPPNAPMNRRPTYNTNDPAQMIPSPNVYPTQQQMAFQQAQRVHAFSPQQQPYFAPQYAQGQNAFGNMPRQHPFPMQTQMSFDPSAYGYGVSPAQYSPIDPRFAASPQFGMAGGFPQDMSQFMMRRSSTDSGPIPSYPRGPPRKPKQSGHALWVGNLPPAALIADLKDHFSRDATDDIESLFLISKSNCAFVNYRTEAACAAAMSRFHDSRFHGVRLVCRLRRGTTSTASTTVPEESSDEPSASSSQSPAPIEDGVDEPSSPTIARSSSIQETPNVDGTGPDPNARVSEKYFIVKSLTAQDLEASVRNNIWATQSHNEEILNKAYDQADNVYLIFSANKSGEYFGYARMASPISGEPISLPSLPPSADDQQPTDSTGSPQSIPTPATATAPKGRIIDDSARGTIFWEADRDTSTDDESKDGNTGCNTQSRSSSSSSSWGKQFTIEWMSTARLPFYRTRGLKNPWNANREVKIARDGTELEPNVGRKLVGMFHRPSVGGAGGQQHPQQQGGGMGFR